MLTTVALNCCFVTFTVETEETDKKLDNPPRFSHVQNVSCIKCGH